MKKVFFIFFAISFVACSYGQNDNRFLLWTFHEEDVNIHGVSVGLWSVNNERNTNTNGIKLELIGLGIGTPLMPSSPVTGSESEFLAYREEPLSEKINGLNLSASGTICPYCRTNGIVAGFIGQINYEVNGMAVSLFGNWTQKQNGIMMAFVGKKVTFVQLEF